MKRPFNGKFRGVVSDNQDPNNLGRVRARVPDVYGDAESGWALPAVPFAGNQVGFYMIPPVNASVWIEFEHGNPDYPIWSGCFWSSAEMPLSPVTVDKKVIRTTSGTITLDESPGAASITIETTGGLKIKMDSQGIELSNGAQTVKLTTTSVSVNDGALEVS